MLLAGCNMINKKSNLKLLLLPLYIFVYIIKIGNIFINFKIEGGGRKSYLLVTEALKCFKMA